MIEHLTQGAIGTFIGIILCRTSYSYVTKKLHSPVKKPLSVTYRNGIPWTKDDATETIPKALDNIIVSIESLREYLDDYMSENDLAGDVAKRSLALLAHRTFLTIRILKRYAHQTQPPEVKNTPEFKEFWGSVDD